MASGPRLLWLSALLFVTSLVSGLLPYALRNSGARMSALTSLGVGSLLGTAAVVILPEGVHMLLRATAPSLHLYLGLSLLLGYLGLYLLEGLFEHSHPDQPLADTEERKALPGTFRDSSFLGLLVHSCIDGISLGATAVSEEGSPAALLVFLSLVAHKVPTAFALGAVMRASLSRRQAFHRLLLLALSTPVCAWLLFLLVGHGLVLPPELLGALLLFSAGTFLYVAVSHMAQLERSLSSKLLQCCGALVPFLFVCLLES